MSKANAPCPCGSKKKYKKCCKVKGLYTKKSELPSTWKNMGQSHPSFRFSIGDRIGDRIETDLDDPEETEGYPQWIPSTIRGFNPNIGAYDILLDYPVGKFGRDVVRLDTNNFTRPFGFTKSATHKTDPCATCGLNEPTDGGVTFVQCAGCRRTRYCTRECQKIDWKNHRVQCQAIVAQNERVSMEIKELIKTGKSEAIQIALRDAVYDDDLIIVRKLLKKRGDDINVNRVDSNGVPLVYIASQNGNVDLLKVLIKAGSNVNQADTTDGASPLYVASQNGNVDLVKVLLKADGNVNQAHNDGRTPLFMASQNGHVDTVKVLLKAGGNVNQAETRAGCTPLYIASQNGNVDLVKVLLKADGNVNQAHNDGRTPLWMASINGHVDIVKVLINAGGNVNQAKTNGVSPLYIASQEGNVDLVKVLLKADGNVNQARTDVGVSPLYIASQNGHVDTVKVLLKAGGNVNQAETRAGCTPLYIASQIGNVDLVKVLLKAGGNVNQARTDDGASPLLIASQNGNVDTVKVLLEAGGNVNQHSHKNTTPLNVACDNGHAEIVRLLLQQPNIDLNTKNKWNNSPLVIATTKKHTDIVQLLKDAGAAYTTKEAVAANDINYIQQWITDEKEKDINEINESLYRACENGNIDIVKLFLNLEDINMNCSFTDGVTSLFIACQDNHPCIVELLVQQPNIDVNIPMTSEQSKGATPLIIASYLGNYKCVQQLLQQSTIDTTLTFQNKTALQWSQPNERATGWEFLESKINKKGRQKILQLF
jgi:ankyrin repeat protein